MPNNTIYCLRCRVKTIAKNPKLTTDKRGRARIQAVCSRCKVAVYRYVAKKKLKGKAGGNLWDDITDSVGTVFNTINDIGKPFRGVAAKIFDKIPGNPLAKLPGGSEPWMGFGNDVLSDTVFKKRGSGFPMPIGIVQRQPRKQMIPGDYGII